jgi:DNA-directed RNA polymerase beta' subunit
MLDSLKQLGFTYATKSGLSIGIDDLIIPAEKPVLVGRARDEVIKVEQQYLEGAITNGERYNKVIAIWSDSARCRKPITPAAISTRCTSWPTREREGRSSRFASWPECAG